MLVLKYTNFRSPPPSATIFSEPPLRVSKNFRSPPSISSSPPLVILNELSLISFGKSTFWTMRKYLFHHFQEKRIKKGTSLRHSAEKLWVHYSSLFHNIYSSLAAGCKHRTEKKKTYVPSQLSLSLRGTLLALHVRLARSILGGSGAASWDDRMFVVKVFCKIDLRANFHHKHSIVPTNCPWVSEDGLGVVCVKGFQTRKRRRVGVCKKAEEDTVKLGALHVSRAQFLI